MRWFAWLVAVALFATACGATSAQGYGYTEGGQSVASKDVPGAAAARARLMALLPAAGAAGWSRSGTPALYVPGNLWEYINGNADLFKAYAFQWLISGKYTHAGLPDAFIMADVYDMRQPINAFGIYSAERAGEIQYLKLGVQGYLGQDLLVFWQGRYLVKLSAVAAGKDAAAVMTDLARRVAKAIPDVAAPPAMLKLLPVEGRIANTEKYTRRDFLGHGFLGNALSTQYRVGKGRVTGFIIDAATPRAATSQLAKLRAFEKGDGKGIASAKIAGAAGFTVRDPYLGAMAAVARGRYVVGAYGGADTKVAASVAARIAQGAAGK